MLVFPLAAIDPIIGVIVVALISPLGAYIIAARRMSGKIATSDAAQLWEESKAIREWSAERLEAADEEIKTLRKRLDYVWKRLRAMEEWNRDLTRELKIARDRIIALEEEVKRVSGKSNSSA